MRKPSMREHTLISTLGLAKNNLMSLASMLRLTAELREHYRLGDPGDGSAHVVFVNADEPSAVSTLSKFKNINRSLTPIMVSSSARSISDEITIVRPLVLCPCDNYGFS
jgi:hypothetical protein